MPLKKLYLIRSKEVVDLVKKNWAGVETLARF